MRGANLPVEARRRLLWASPFPDLDREDDVDTARQ